MGGVLFGFALEQGEQGTLTVYYPTKIPAVRYP